MFNQLRKLLKREPQAQPQQDINKPVGEIGGRQYNFGGDFLPPQTLHVQPQGMILPQNQGGGENPIDPQFGVVGDFNPIPSLQAPRTFWQNTDGQRRDMLNPQIQDDTFQSIRRLLNR